MILKRLRSPSRVSLNDVVLTLFPLLLWAGLTYSRSALIHPWCGAAPLACTASHVPAIDRVALGWENGDADGLSFLLQNTAGAVAIALPVVYGATQVVAGSLAAPLALIQIGTDLVLLLETTGWNGVGIELSHIIGQRPRPFVYSDPTLRGLDPAHYISFYSGHTSFVAAMSVALFLIFLTHGLNRTALTLLVSVGFLATVATGVCRVLAGRHFPTDVICAAFAGTFIAFIIAFTHHKTRPGP